MPNALIIDPELYSQPPVNAVPGARLVSRSIEALAAQLVNTNIFALGVLPAGHKLMFVALETDDLDAAGPTVTIHVGILNTYYNEKVAAVGNSAAYNSGGQTNIATQPELVSGHNIFTSSTVAQSGGRVNPSLAFTDAIGVDYNKDRIIAVQLGVDPTSAQTGTINLVYGLDVA